MDKSDSSTHFTNFLPNPLREQARKAIAASRARAIDFDPSPEFDPPTPDQLETLDVVEALHRLCERVGAERLQHLLKFVAAARGENLT